MYKYQCNLLICVHLGCTKCGVLASTPASCHSYVDPDVALVNHDMTQYYDLNVPYPTNNEQNIAILKKTLDLLIECALFYANLMSSWLSRCGIEP
jgi:hypothetical protein